MKDPEKICPYVPGSAEKQCLTDRSCLPCEGIGAPLSADEAEKLTSDISSDWRIVENHHLEREFRFPDFAAALDFVNRIGAIAEQEGHHPDIELGWGRVSVSLRTHALEGLSENDFILAAKIDDESLSA